MATITFFMLRGSDIMGSGQLLEMMRRRRTVRDYLPDPVNGEALQRILKTTTLAPSGADTLPYTFVVVTNDETKRRIREEAETVESDHPHSECDDLQKLFRETEIPTEKAFLTQAPVLIVVAGDTSKPYWLESTWIAIAYIILAIENEGLASLTYTPPKTEFLNSILEIPSEFAPQAIVPVGHARGKSTPKDSRPEGKIYHEKYG